jgi:hypothetical protein
VERDKFALELDRAIRPVFMVPFICFLIFPSLVCIAPRFRSPQLATMIGRNGDWFKNDADKPNPNPATPKISGNTSPNIDLAILSHDFARRKFEVSQG